MIECIGWDLGGAHLKAVRLDANGRIAGAVQRPCPLWRGVSYLEQAVAEATDALGRTRRHAVTMTGELADIFPNRNEGVVQLVDTMARSLPEAELLVFAGLRGFVTPDKSRENAVDIASTNWLASAQFAARHCREGIFIDMGSTTTDLIPLQNGKADPVGLTDAARLASEELVYTGVVRTPLMAVAARVPFGGQWQRIAAEYFATTADVHRLTGCLDPAHDMADTADGAGKSLEESARRLARMVGRDFEEASMPAWADLAEFFVEAQMTQLQEAVERIQSRMLNHRKSPLIGAGAGRFMVHQLAQRLNRDYIDFASLVDGDAASREWSAVCAPAFSVAHLGAQQELAA
jgi:probable H4MPT-linked C1 transfer pathway protein